MKVLLVIALALAACADERVLSVPCDGGECGAHVHPDGILDPTSPEFHGKVLQRHNWSFDTCAQCHGQDFNGGKSGKPCTKCHTDGPTACRTCHGQDGPVTGAHQIHHAAGFDCSECHIKPASWDAPGHIIDDQPPAEINFGARAALTIDPAKRLGPPTWDGEKCTNVYCHGDVLSSSSGTLSQPRWDQPPTGGCNRCHGAPPPSHARADCATCHPPGSPHIDGVVQIGRTSGCDGCHGTAASPAPPVDLSGNLYTTAIGVGAHQAHLDVPNGLRGPISCDTCHVVPATITAPGHLDAAPADVTPSLTWNRDLQTCGTAWCHGPAKPVWTTQGGAACGTCHGIPPSDTPHLPSMTLFQCATCHTATVTAFGNIIVTNGTSHHMDGVIDAN